MVFEDRRREGEGAFERVYDLCSLQEMEERNRKKLREGRGVWIGIYFLSSGGWKSEIKVSAGFVSPEASLLAL